MRGIEWFKSFGAFIALEHWRFTAWVLGSLGSWDSESNSENQNPSIHQGGGDGWLLVWLCSSGPFLTMNFEFDHGPGPGPELDNIW